MDTVVQLNLLDILLIQKVKNKSRLIGTPCQCAQDKYIMKDTGECVDSCLYGYYADFQLGNNYCVKSALCGPDALSKFIMNVVLINYV